MLDTLDVESTPDAVLLLVLLGGATVSAWVPVLTAEVGVGDSVGHFVGVGVGGGGGCCVGVGGGSVTTGAGVALAAHL